MDCDNPQFCLVSIYSPIINHQPPSGFEHFSRATHLRSLGILRGVFIKNPQPVDHGPRNFARVTHPDYQGVLCNLFLFQSVQEPCNIWTVSRHHAGLGVQMVHVRIVEVGGYALQLLTISGPVDEEGLWILRPAARPGPQQINGWSIFEWWNSKSQHLELTNSLKSLGHTKRCHGIQGFEGFKLSPWTIDPLSKATKKPFYDSNRYIYI